MVGSLVKMLIMPTMKREANHKAQTGAKSREIHFVPNCWMTNYISRGRPWRGTSTTMIAIEMGTMELLREGAGTAIPNVSCCP